jgi:SAM-dependent methyltransferase
MAERQPSNVDNNTVSGFGDEWSRFDQSKLDPSESLELFNSYFQNFPWDILPQNPSGFDLGCGSGRWAHHVALRIAGGTLHCVDPSEALGVARNNLKTHKNCEFHSATVDNIPIPDASMDFGYSLGVLHHVPDTAQGLQCCVSKLKPGAPFLLYLYYAFDNRPTWFRAVWKLSDIIRRGVSRLPHSARYIVTQFIAIVAYLPLARTARFLEKMGLNIEAFPLSSYRNRTFYTMRTDALDRFGTSLEKRFTKAEIIQLMTQTGLVDVVFNDTGACWCAVGFRSEHEVGNHLS